MRYKKRKIRLEKDKVNDRRIKYSNLVFKKMYLKMVSYFKVSIKSQYKLYQSALNEIKWQWGMLYTKDIKYTKVIWHKIMTQT